MDYGYVRRSTPKQDVQRQIRNIQEVCPDAKLFIDTFTGTKKEGRKEWLRLMKTVKSGDTIYYDAAARMSRNADEGVEDYETLYYKGVNLIFIHDPHVNTDVFRKALNTMVPMTGTEVDYILEGINKYLMAVAKQQVRLCFEQAEQEVQTLRRRTREGLLTAKLNGKQIGLPEGTKLTTKKSIKCKKKILEHSKSFNGNLKDKECIAILGISRNTFYKYKRELEAEREQADDATF